MIKWGQKIVRIPWLMVKLTYHKLYSFRLGAKASDLFSLPSVWFLHENSMHSIENAYPHFLQSRIFEVWSPKNKRTVYVIDVQFADPKVDVH